MIDERKEEMASLYALDLLEGAEKAAFELELKSDRELQVLVAQLRDASAQLALVARPVTPSDGLKARVLASIAGTPQSARTESNATGLLPSAPARPGGKVIAFPVMGWLGWAAAACFAVATIFVTNRYMSVRTESISLQNDLAMTKVETQSVRQQLEAEHIVSGKQIADLQTQQTAAAAQVADLSSKQDSAAAQIAQLRREGDLAQLKITKLASLVGTPEAAAFAVWNPLKKEGVLTVEKLAALQADQDYQLWVFDPKKPDPVSCDVFSVDEKGTAHYQFRPDQQIGSAAVFAVTRERKGGVPKPQGPVVLKGDL